MKETPDAWEAIHEQFKSVTAVFWDEVWSLESQVALESLRQRVLFGGNPQRWLDTEALFHFGL